MAFIHNLLKNKHEAKLMALDFIKYIGPGFLVTIGFIDPGNWAVNVSAGSQYGYSILWVITFATIMLIMLQHNAAHLGIVTGHCLSEAATIYLKPWLSKIILLSAMIAAIATALAEILGSAIALNMLFGLPLMLGMIIISVFIAVMLLTNSYKKIEKWIIGFVSLIGISFIIELCFVHVQWTTALKGCVLPSLPNGAMLTIMSVLGAVVMPSNLFLHSEIIQSRQWNLKDEKIIEKQLKYEFLDTTLSMVVGWAINSAMIIIAAATFFIKKVPVSELSQAHDMLEPILGNFASTIFAVALLLSGIASCITVGMSGGSIFAGIYGESYDINDSHTKIGVLATIIPAVLITFLIKNPLKGLIYSQMILSIQLPVTIFLQIYLTSSRKIMGKYKNSKKDKIILWTLGIIISLLNIMLFIDAF
jgi:manganese transport protein